MTGQHATLVDESGSRKSAIIHQLTATEVIFRLPNYQKGLHHARIECLKFNRAKNCWEIRPDLGRKDEISDAN